MSNEPLKAHSLAEAYLYMIATRCESCAAGPLQGGDAKPISSSGDQTIVDVNVACGSCGAASVLRFDVPTGHLQASPGTPVTVNPTSQPSKILDVGQWIVLFRVITEAAAKESDQGQARHLGLEAAQCLEEALKFYDDPSNDLPPPEAVFSEPTERRLREAPEQFSRRRLIELRAKLPTSTKMRSALERGQRPDR